MKIVLKSLEQGLAYNILYMCLVIAIIDNTWVTVDMQFQLSHLIRSLPIFAIQSSLQLWWLVKLLGWTFIFSDHNFSTVASAQTRLGSYTYSSRLSHIITSLECIASTMTEISTSGLIKLKPHSPNLWCLVWRTDF